MKPCSEVSKVFAEATSAFWKYNSGIKIGRGNIRSDSEPPFTHSITSRCIAVVLPVPTSAITTACFSVNNLVNDSRGDSCSDGVANERNLAPSKSIDEIEDEI